MRKRRKMKSRKRNRKITVLTFSEKKFVLWNITPIEVVALWQHITCIFCTQVFNHLSCGTSPH
jgi:hypothetical protein